MIEFMKQSMLDFFPYYSQKITKSMCQYISLSVNVDCENHITLSAVSPCQSDFPLHKSQQSFQPGWCKNQRLVNVKLIRMKVAVSQGSLDTIQKPNRTLKNKTRKSCLSTCAAVGRSLVCSVNSLKCGKHEKYTISLFSYLFPRI